MSSNYFNKLFSAEEIDLYWKLNPSTIIFLEDTFWLNKNNSDIEPVIILIKNEGIGGSNIFLFKTLLISKVNNLLEIGFGATKL